MRKLFFLSLILLFTTTAYAQIEKLKDLGIEFYLPTNTWKKGEANNTNSLIIYKYKRQAIVDAKGRGVIANLSFIAENVPDTLSVVNYTMQKRIQKPFEVMEVLSASGMNPKLKHNNAIGYKSNYTDSKSIPHTLYIVHLIEKQKGIQVIMDITTELLPKVEPEFLKIVGSIKSNG